jgi:hypothetical protein
MWKTFNDRIINPVLVRYDTLTTKTVPRAIGFGTRAIGVYIITNNTLNNLFIHRQKSSKKEIS